LPKAIHRATLYDLAKRGAEHRVDELKAELTLLLKQFPHLRRATAHRLGSLAEAVEAPIRGKQRRQKWSAEARKAVSERMRKYWAKRRKVKK
jgi:hypothetical protein